MLPCRLRVRVQDSNGCRDVHVCVLRNRISFLSTVSPSIAFIFHGRSPLPTHPSPFRLLVHFFLFFFFLFPLFSTEIVRSPLLIKRNEVRVNICGGKRRNRREKRHLKGEVLTSLCFVIYRAGGDRKATSNRAELLTGISGFDLGAIRLSRWSLLDGWKLRGRIEDS